MAAFNRPVSASYQVHETVRVDTQDNEDHTFCGIMFPIKAKDVLPVDKIVLHSVAVRGQLGQISVWVTHPTNVRPDYNGNYNVRLRRNIDRHWTKIYEKFHAPSPRKYVTLDLTQPPPPNNNNNPDVGGVVLTPGQVRILYIHSTLDGDEAIVYDNTDPALQIHHHHMHQGINNNNNNNANLPPRYQDDCIAVYTGKAHLSTTPFGQTPIWGWGNAWRDRREFVGQLQYGTVYRCWNPEINHRFGTNFRHTVQQLKRLQACHRAPFCHLPDECIYYILNMCRWDWFNDNGQDMKRLCRLRKQQQRQLEQQQQQSTAAAAAQPMDVADAGNDESDSDDDDDDDDTMEEEHEENNNNNNNDWAYQLVQQQLRQQEEAAAAAAAAAGNNNDNGSDDDDGSNESDESAWERANGYRADNAAFTFRDVSSSDESDDDESDDDDDNRQQQPHGFFRRQFARIHVLQALGQGGGGGPRDDDRNYEDEDEDEDDDDDDSFMDDEDSDEE